MQISHRSSVAVAALMFTLVIAYMQSPTQAQQPVPLRISSPAPHMLQAAPPAQAQASQTAQGELLDVDSKASSITIKTATAAEMTFHFNEQTRISGAQKGVAGLATMTGSQVTVQYRKDGSTNLATSIDVRSSGSQEPVK